jgi:hypothetical protein
MSNVNNRIKSQKQGPAILAALVMTAVIGFLIVGLGINALFNNNVATAQAVGLPDPSLSVDRATIDQLQSLIEQYQTREVQYQTEMQQAADQLNQTNAELQRYQDLVAALQNSGIIQITADGRVFVGRGLSGERQNGFNGDD